MKVIHGRFKERVPRTPTVYSFRFKLEEKVNFIPGQFMEVIFGEDEDLKHFLSFSSPPGKDYIEFTKRLSLSKFSQRLRQLNVGDEALFRLPFGNCVFKDEYRRVGFLIGGIGITPVISILGYIEGRGLKTDVFLIYGNRDIQEIAFKKELDDWKERMALKVVYLVDEGGFTVPDVREGKIDKELLQKYVQELKDRVNFVFGPPKMVTAVIALLREMGIEEDKVKWEGFTGY